MNDLRRTLLWSVFAVSLLMMWDGWLRHTGQPSLFAPPAPHAETATGPQGTPGTGSSASLPTAAATPGTALAATPGAASASAPAAHELVTFTTDVAKVTLDTQGGDVVKVELLKHLDQDDASKNVVVLTQTPVHTYVAQTGLVGGGASEHLPTHLTPMTVLTPQRTLADGSNELVVKLESAPVDGVKLLKTFTFKRGEYAIGVKHEVVNASSATVHPQLYLQLTRDGAQPVHVGPSFLGGPQAYTGPAVYSAKAKYQKVDFKHLDENSAEFEKTDTHGWVAMVQHYFASAWLHNEATPRSFFVEKTAPNLYRAGMLFPLGDVAAGQSKSFDATLFVGPQEEKKLSALAPGLELVKDYGWQRVLAEPLFWLLDQLHALIGNWGWAIVALVVLLKAAFFWLNAKAYQSMAKMKALNPRIQAMQETYKDDPQRKQQEMLKIYREEKVNPIGGCLPIVIQIPVFISLYSVLLSSVEMRNAPWIGWIHDLSIKDPFFILPALMTASTLLQTWLNPTPPDPVQAKMMWIMPMLFSVMFFFFPAGLVLYWLTNNVLSIAQQWMINRKIEAAAAAKA
jgi:YidC/Oxa1 family membrane protein insertase